MTRLLLVDDHASSRQPLAMLLQMELEFSEIRQAGTIEEALPLLPGTELAIVDLGLPDGDGATLIRALLRVEPAVRVLVLTSSSDRLDAARALAAGAHGVVNKVADIDEIIAALRAIGTGNSLITAEQAADLIEIDRNDRARLFGSGARAIRLTPREIDVLQALTDGLSDREIAARLQIGTETVRTHLANIYGKLGVDSRLQALAVAVRQGLIPTNTHR